MHPETRTGAAVLRVERDDPGCLRASGLGFGGGDAAAFEQLRDLV